MPAINRFASVAVWALWCVCAVAAQTTSTTTSAPAELHISIGARQIKFTPLRSYQELRLEIFNNSGELLYASGAVTEAELNYDLHDSNGQPLASGLYAYTLTVKAAETETPRPHQGHFIIEKGQDQIWLTSKDADSIGAAVTGGALTVARSPERTTAGYLAPGRTLSERAGLQRDTQGRTIVEEPAETTRRLTPNISGSGTTGRITKWNDGPNGVVGDSIMTQNGTQLDVAGNVNTTGEYRISNLSVFRSNAGLGNLSLGAYGGSANNGDGNIFIGQYAGSANTTGQSNFFLGSYAGLRNTTGTSNLFIGAYAGEDNLTGGTNMFIGGAAGADNTTGSFNLFLGGGAGRLNTTGQSNMFLGGQAGYNNTTGDRSVFIGTNAGINNTTGSGNTYIGFEARGNVGTLTNATAIGTNAYVTASNSLILGGFSNNGNGALADTNVGIGVAAPAARLHVVNNTGGYAIFGYASSGYGVFGQATGAGYGVFGTNTDYQVNGRAGHFDGDVTVSHNLSVSGNLSKGGGSFKIDHPLNPANKYLYHSFVESPDMKNIYDGNVTTDANGEATVTMPDYFAALNRDFRYQLTVIGQFAQAIIAEKLIGNQFKIRTSLPNVEVSWQVTGIRQDAYAEAHRIRVEEEKPEQERGSYLHPELHGQPEEKGVEWARNPELMRQLKQRREQGQTEKKQN